jgi:hypothetical protein
MVFVQRALRRRAKRSQFRPSGAKPWKRIAKPFLLTANLHSSSHPSIKNRVTPSEQKFLFVLVREALRRGSGNEIEVNRLHKKHLPALRSLDFVTGSELTEKAFQKYFDTFEITSCPTEVQHLADSFEIAIRWRRPHGVVSNKLDRAGDGSAYRNLRTVFVKDGAKLETWYHEFGHILYGCIKNNPDILALFKRLQQQTILTCPVVLHDQMTPVQHHLTNELVSPSPGRYVLINGRYHGLDHSGGDADGEADELWASLFEEYQSGRELKTEIRNLIEGIIAALKALSKPLDPCDKD